MLQLFVTYLLQIMEGKSSPIELGGICHDPKPSLFDESTC